MSFGSNNTLYILGNPSIDLVLTSDGITVDNRPMNQTKLTIHKGFDSQLNFHVRNRDRVLQNLSGKTLYASVINPNTNKRVVFKQLTLVNSGTTGEAKLNFVPGDLTNLSPGLYQISISESSDSGVTQSPLYANQNDRIITDLEIRSSLEYDPVATQEQATFTQTQNTDLGDPANVFVTSAMYGNQDNNFTSSQHTIGIYMTDFVGNVTIQGSALSSTPTQDSDWYNINVQGDSGSDAVPFSTAFNGIDAYNFNVNTNWVRVKFDKTSGSLDKVLLRN